MEPETEEQPEREPMTDAEIAARAVLLQQLAALAPGDFS